MMTRARDSRLLMLALVCCTVLPGFFLGGCANPPGIEISNSSGRALKVEYLGVRGDGSTELYSSGTVADGSLVTYKVEQQGTHGARIRFSLPEAPEDESSIVQLKLPDQKTRYYDLVYISGRLVAREQSKSLLDRGVEKRGDTSSRSTRDRR